MRFVKSLSSIIALSCTLALAFCGKAEARDKSDQEELKVMRLLGECLRKHVTTDTVIELRLDKIKNPYYHADKINDADSLNGVTLRADLGIEMPHREKFSSKWSDWKIGSFDFVATEKNGITSIVIHPLVADNQADLFDGGFGWNEGNPWSCTSDNRSAKEKARQDEEMLAAKRAQEEKEDAKRDRSTEARLGLGEIPKYAVFISEVNDKYEDVCLRTKIDTVIYSYTNTDIVDTTKRFLKLVKGANFLTDLTRFKDVSPRNGLIYGQINPQLFGWVASSTLEPVDCHGNPNLSLNP